MNLQKTMLFQVHRNFSLLLLKKTHNYLNDSNDEKTSHMESHSLENNLYFYSPVDQESSLLLEQKLLH